MVIGKSRTIMDENIDLREDPAPRRSGSKMIIKMLHLLEDLLYYL